MTATAVGAATLRHLSSLATDGHPVLSVYVDLDPSRFPTPSARDAELEALLSDAGARRADAELVRGVFAERPELLRESSGLAIFASTDAGVVEAVLLPTHVEPMAVVDTIPWLEPLAALITSENWGVAVVSRRSARLFRGGTNSMVEFATIDDELHRRHAQGGWSQARYQRGIEQQVAEHAEHVGESLSRAHRRHPFDHLVVVAADELWPVVEATLDDDLRARLASHVALDLEHATADEIAHAVAPTVAEAERRREGALIARLEEAVGTGGPAVAGIDEVLAMLEQERVETLLISHGAELTAALCPRCGRLSAPPKNHCPLDGAPLAVVDAVEHSVELAASQGIEVVVLHHEPRALDVHGSIAALLRW